MSLSVNKNKGKLIMAANSLGSPADIPARSLDALRQSDLVIFEEDRQARQSLKAAGIHREYLKFSEHHQTATLDALSRCLEQNGQACYMSDQGMPVLADPGRQLLAIAYRQGAHIEVIPGPSSVTAALAACPFLTDRFRYEGFLPRDTGERLATLQGLREEKAPLVLLDTPYRREALLAAVTEAFGPERQGLLALDISGPNEAYHLATLKELSTLPREKLNFVLVIEGQPQAEKPTLNLKAKGSGARRKKK